MTVNTNNETVLSHNKKMNVLAFLMQETGVLDQQATSSCIRVSKAWHTASQVYANAYLKRSSDHPYFQLHKNLCDRCSNESTSKYSQLKCLLRSLKTSLDTMDHSIDRFHSSFETVYQDNKAIRVSFFIASLDDMFPDEFYENFENNLKTTSLSEEQKNLILLQVSYFNYWEILNLLIHQGANINAADRDGCTALMIAAQNGHLEIVQTLIKNGADINATDQDGCTALMVAAQNGHLEIIQALLKSGADINAVDQDDFAALMIAAQNGHLEIVQTLIKNGVDINATDQDGFTALMVATQNGYLEITQTLLKSGADINAVDQDDFTALMIAAQNGHLEIVQALIQNGANINAVDQDGFTALRIAAQNGHLEIVQTLINNKAT